MDVSEAYTILVEKHDRCGKAWDCCGVLYFQREYDELLRTASIGPGSRVLDLGSGTGGLTSAASQKLGRGVSLVGVDILPGWIDIARQKAEANRTRSVEFKLMNIESLEFPDRSFDHVVSNFVLCCSFHYDRVVKQAYRVLKQGGKFSYNHPGPHDSVLSSIFDKIFSKYTSKEPSESLRKAREANELQLNMYSRYRDPFVALNTMRAASFRNVEARIVYHTHSFSTVENWIDQWFYLGNEDPEFVEMGPKNSNAMIKELQSAFQPFWSRDGYTAELETLCITGLK